MRNRRTHFQAPVIVLAQAGDPYAHFFARKDFRRDYVAAPPIASCC